MGQNFSSLEYCNCQDPSAKPYAVLKCTYTVAPIFFVFSLNKIRIFFGVFQCKHFLNRSNPRFSVPLQSPTRNGSRPHIGDLAWARLWRQMENDAKVLTVIILFFGVFRQLSTTKIISLGLHGRQNSEKFYIVLHFVGFRDELWLRRLEN